MPVIGVIEPGARAAAAASRGGPIGVIGTAGTIASNAYARAIHGLGPDARVEQRACPLFVPLVEEGWFEHPAAELIAREYLEPLRRAGVDTLVLGCTHYPLLKPLLQRIMGQGVAADRQRGGDRDRAWPGAARRLAWPRRRARRRPPVRGERRRGPLPSGGRAVYRRAAGAGGSGADGVNRCSSAPRSVAMA